MRVVTRPEAPLDKDVTSDSRAIAAFSILAFWPLHEHNLGDLWGGDAVTSCKAALSFAVLLLVSAPLALGQEKQEPDLKATVAFMNRMVEPEHRVIDMPNHCEFEILNNVVFTYYLVDGTAPSSNPKTGQARTDEFGNPLQQFTFAEIADPFFLERFNLSDIDPSSIKSKGGAASLEFSQKHDPLKPADLETTDITLVLFDATDMKKSIEVGGLKDSGPSNARKIFNKTGDVSGRIVVFKSKDRAERYVTAFVHAVKLCGGKPADFPPTPTDKK
jgi:hypothetical protein